MNKDFDTWNQQKKTLQSKADSPHFNEGDIWLCYRMGKVKTTEIKIIKEKVRMLLS